jgi:hypothetical protein
MLRLSLFVGIAVGEYWRLLTVAEHNHRVALGDEFTPDVTSLHY